jgi:hypothetical protein
MAYIANRPTENSSLSCNERLFIIICAGEADKLRSLVEGINLQLGKPVDPDFLRHFLLPYARSRSSGRVQWSRYPALGKKP